MSDINKLRFILNDQIPEFYREEFPMFQEFLAQYYKFLETTYVGKLDSIRDVDASLDVYTDALKTELAKNVPEFGSLNDRDFLKFAQNFYASRGTEDSYKFLFRAMYGKELDIVYPSKFILRGSDGRWQQDISFVATVTSGSISSIIGKRVEILGSEGSVYVTPIQYIQVGASSYRVFIDRFYTGSWSVGSTITDGSFAATIERTISKTVIENGGSDFISGKIFEVSSAYGDIRIRVRHVDDTGSIEKAEVVYAEGAVPNTIWVKFDGTTATASTSYPSFAAQDLVCRLETGSILKYPGFYSSTDGFLSDINRLQDNDYYQQFSYVLKLEDQADTFKDLVKRLLHPVGTSLWIQYDLSAEFELTPELDTFEETELAIVERAEPTDNTVFNFRKVLSETITTSESNTLKVNKQLADTVTVTENGSVAILAAQTYASADYFAETYATGGTSYSNW